MISLKRNKKTGELVEATGVTSQQWRIYQPNQNKDFTISRRYNDLRENYIELYTLWSVFSCHKINVLDRHDKVNAKV